MSVETSINLSLHEKRRRNLLFLIWSEFGGSQTAFAVFMGVQISQVNRWVRGTNPANKTLSAKTVEKVEQMCKKPHGWLDTAESPDVTAVDKQSLPPPKILYPRHFSPKNVDTVCFSPKTQGREGGEKLQDFEIVTKAWFEADDSDRAVPLAWAKAFLKNRC